MARRRNECDSTNFVQESMSSLSEIRLNDATVISLCDSPFCRFWVIPALYTEFINPSLALYLAIFT